MTKLSEFEEMYLKRLFEAHVDNPSAIVKTTQLAEMMDVSPASTTEMIQRLAGRELVTHIPYKGCRLTPDGFQQAAMIKRREGLIEILLTEIIGFEGDVLEAACKIEHAIDEELEMALDKMLGYPERTPGGGRIPIIERQLEPMRSGLLLPLSALPLGSTATIEIMAMRPTDARTLEMTGVKIGSKVSSTDDGISCNGSVIKMSKAISLRILARTDEVM
jgi:DtxR family Mn-dependent transcriptional regulator